MPVWKYRSVEEMPQAWTMNRHTALARRILALARLRIIAEPLNRPRGVTKFRSYEELVADRNKYKSARLARIQAKNALN
jgi:hypothetical protein